MDNLKKFDIIDYSLYEAMKKEIKLDCLSIINRNAIIADNKEILLDTVRCYSFVLQYASPRLRDDYDVVMKAISIYGSALQFVSERLRDNYDVVLTSVSKYGYALEYASPRLRDNEEIVQIAISNSDGIAIKYASERLQKKFKETQ